MDFPPPNEALQILCMNAFGQDSPYEGFEKLAWEVTRLAGMLPLGLRVIGSHLLGMSKKEWKAELPRLRVRLDGEICNTLKFSYDALNDEDKDLFLHIACFFNDEGIDHTFEDTLRHKFSNVGQGLRVLVQKSLISEEKIRPMHNLLVQLGREIVRNQSINEPGKRQFLVDDKEIGEVLADHHTGNKSVIGINLSYSTGDKIIPSERAFEETSNLQFLRIDSFSNVHLQQGLNYLPPKLRILHWDYFPMTCLPSKFNPKFLFKIILRFSELEKLWEGNQPLTKLKVMDLSYAANLKELPDLSTATNLLEMNLSSSSSLMEISSSIGGATNIRCLILSNCSSLVHLPLFIGNIINLRELYLSGCINLVELPSSIGNIINLEVLNFYGCSSLVKLPSSIGNVITIRKLDLSGCSSLVELPLTIGNIINLQKLYLSGCSKLVELPSSIGNIVNLQQLDLSECSTIVGLPPSIGNIINLRKLDLSGCTSLVGFPSSVENLINLKKLYINECINLVELPSFIGSIINLEKIDLSGCSNLVDIPSSIGNIINLQELYLNGCSNIVKIPSSIGNIINLKKLDIIGCSSLVELPPSVRNISNLLIFDGRWL